MRQKVLKKMILVAMFSAIAYVLCLIAHFVPLAIVPGASFLKYDPKDIIIAISGLVLGPWYALGISAVTSLIEMVTISTTGFYGLIMNIISTCSFVLPAAFVYKYNRSFVGAIISLFVGLLVNIAMMTLWNLIITPIYMGVERQVIIDNFLLPIILFNILKTSINIVGVLLLYKPIVMLLRKMKLVESKEGKNTALKTFFVTLAIAAVLALIIILIIVIINK